MKHHTPHALMPPPPRRNNPNDLHKLSPLTNDGDSPTSLQGGGLQIFYSTHCLLFFLAIGSDQHQNPPGCQPWKISERSQDAPQIEQKPKIAQNTIPQAKPQPPTPIKLLFDFSLIYTVLRKAGNQGEQESPFSWEALLPKHYPTPQHSQTDQKNTKSRIHKRQGIKAAKP